MASIRDLISNRTIHYVKPSQTVFEAASYMVERNVGAVPVLEDAKLVGIFSERDIMRRVVTEGRDPAYHAHRGGNEHGAAYAGAERLFRRRDVPDADARRASSAGVRRTHPGWLSSLRDLLRCHLDEKSGEAEMMRAYIQTST